MFPLLHDACVSESEPSPAPRGRRRTAAAGAIVLCLLLTAVYAVYLLSFRGEFWIAVRGRWLLVSCVGLLVVGTVVTVVRLVGQPTPSRRSTVRSIGRWVWAALLLVAAVQLWWVGRQLAYGAMGAVPPPAIWLLRLPFVGYCAFFVAVAVALVVRAVRRRPTQLLTGAVALGLPFVLGTAGFAVLRATADAAWTPGVSHQPLFTPGDQPRRSYRIPALTALPDDTVLAFAESREAAMSDLMDIDIVMRRSGDGGRSWTPIQVVAADGDHTVHSPTPVYDPATSTVWLPYCVDYERLFVISSTDAGTTWSEPRDLGQELDIPAGTWCHNGPGNGIVLADGRIVVPTTQDTPRVLYSDDHGTTWHLGEPMADEGEEPQIFQRVDGTLCATIRTGLGEPRNGTCSEDGGETWGPVEPDPHLVDADTQASVMRLSGDGDGLPNRLLFSNPARPYRAMMTLRLSPDDGATWPVSRLLYRGAAGYSDIAVLEDHTILVAFEAGPDDLRQGIVLARVDPGWLTDDPPQDTS